MSAIFKKFESIKGGLDYREFCALMDFQSNAVVASSRPTNTETTALLNRIRRVLEDNLGSSAQSARRIKDTFSDIDTDRSGSINKRELGKAFYVLKVDVNAREIDTLFEQFDRDGNGTLDYNEFLRLIGFQPSESRGVSERKS